MRLAFQKYQGTGNDFIILDGFRSLFIPSRQQISHLCDRRFGIGADGLMIIKPCEGMDFEMLYFNSDGAPGSMCGNGGRCLIKFAWLNGYCGESCHFLAVDGPHAGKVMEEGRLVSLQMKDGIQPFARPDGAWFADTGSPHYVRLCTSSVENVVAQGRHIRFSEEFQKEGVNVNFLYIDNGKLQIRTYERGVEDETLSCGTGVTAAALIAHKAGWIDSEKDNCTLETKGGRLTVHFKSGALSYTDIWLEGPAEKIFEGEVDL